MAGVKSAHDNLSASDARAIEQRPLMMALRTVVVASVFMLFCHSSWAEALHRLSGAQIKQQFTGKVLTDGTHFRETYLAGGNLVVNEMGHSPATGTWRVNNDQLCKVVPGILDGCYEVWGAGDRIELHFGNAPPLEAFLRSATAK